MEKNVAKLEEKITETDMAGERFRRASFCTKDKGKQSLQNLCLTFMNKKKSELVCVKNNADQE